MIAENNLARRSRGRLADDAWRRGIWCALVVRSLTGSEQDAPRQVAADHKVVAGAAIPATTAACGLIQRRFFSELLCTQKCTQKRDSGPLRRFATLSGIRSIRDASEALGCPLPCPTATKPATPTQLVRTR